jgi:polyhydroxyalkanoate synthesis regulator phasin
MANKDSFQKYLDAGVAFTNLTRARAEELVSDLVQSGEFRGDARAKVDELIERSRKSQEAMFAQVRQEVDRQLEHLGITNLEDLAKQVASVIGRTAEAGRAAAGGRGPTAKKASAKKATAKKSPAKKATAKKATAKKSTAKKSTAKKSTAKKSTAKKAAAKKSPAKKATAKKAAAKRSAATKRSSPRTAG